MCEQKSKTGRCHVHNESAEQHVTNHGQVFLELARVPTAIMEGHLLSLNGSINGNDLKVPLIGRGEDEEVGVSRSTAVPAAAAASKHSLGFGALVFLIYYNIGVPFGDEEVGTTWGGVGLVLA